MHEARVYKDIAAGGGVLDATSVTLAATRPTSSVQVCSDLLYWTAAEIGVKQAEKDLASRSSTTRRRGDAARG